MSAPNLDLLASVQDLLLELASEREIEGLLKLSVDGLASNPGVALARIWLLREGDLCDTCAMASECKRFVPCLHLAVSAGVSVVDPADDWSRTTGDFRRIPIGQRKVGSVALTTEPVWVPDTERDATWISRPDWARSEGIRSFGGQPLVFRGEILGVVGLFTRSPLDEAALAALRVVADHIAAALATARAFEENDRLRRQLEVENEYLRDDLTEARAFGEIIGVSPAIRAIAQQVRQVAPTDASVLVLGESGTGKELVARQIHLCSDRADRPLIRVNCASIPRELFESEFFGHVKGAFTGAVKDRVGRFAAADGGTLFLDEVGEIPLELQSKLLRVLQEGQFERVGEDRTRSADVRIVAATNRDLAEEVRAGRFREDLYYRLNVFPIEVPALRQRAEDVVLLAEHFLAAATRKLKRPAELSDANRDALRRYDWPGNVRELQNVIERAVITARAGAIRLDLAASATTPSAPSEPVEADRVLTDREIREIEKRNLVAALEQAQGRVYGPGGAAELLGLKPTTVASRLKKLGLKGDRAEPR